jgi:malonate decarboxylase acyl carrier protein
MERLHFEYAASQPIKQRAHVGVVGSGDLEVLLEPSPDQKTHVTVITSVDGFGKTWKLVMDRFFRVIDMQLPSRFMTLGRHLERSLFAWSKRWKGARHEPANPA